MSAPTSTPRVWFITGSSRGLGLSLTTHALSLGDSVIATCRQPSSLSALHTQYPTTLLPVALDVSIASDVLAAVKAGHDHFGRIDVVVNNAGYADTASVEDCSMDSFIDQVNTNYLGVVYVTKAVLPILRKQGSGHIFNVSSLGARFAAPGLAAYQSAKAAVSAFSCVLAQEVAALNIKIICLEPGGIRTDWAGSSMKIPEISEPYKVSVGAFAEMIKQYAGQEPSLPDKIAKIVVDLLKEDEPPLRLLMGTDGVAYGAMIAEKMKGEDEKWKSLSLSTV